MVSDCDRNNLAPLILSSGRGIFALVGDPSKVETAEKQVKAALNSAMSGGWFTELKSADQPLGGSVLPVGFPPNNISQATHDGLQPKRDTYDDDGEDGGGWNLDYAKDTALEYGLEIRVSST